MEAAGYPSPSGNENEADIGGNIEKQEFEALAKLCNREFAQEMANGGIYARQMTTLIENEDSPFSELFQDLPWGKNPGNARMLFGKKLMKMKNRVFAGYKLKLVKDPGKTNATLRKWIWVAVDTRQKSFDDKAKIDDEEQSANSRQNNSSNSSNSISNLAYANKFPLGEAGKPIIPIIPIILTSKTSETPTTDKPKILDLYITEGTDSNRVSTKYLFLCAFISI